MRIPAVTKVKIVVAACLPFALGGCPPNTIHNPQLPNGFVCPVVPTNLSPPGTVFRVDAQGVSFTVYVPNPTLSLRTSSFGNFSSSSQKEVNAGIVAQLLKINIGVNASADTKYNITQNYSGATFLDTTDSDVQPIVDRVKQMQQVPGEKYYIVREVMSATGMEYDFDRDISDSFGVDVKIKVVQVDPKASYTNTGKFSFNTTFNPPVYACSKSEEIR